jgi:hypothetical protein
MIDNRWLLKYTFVNVVESIRWVRSHLSKEGRHARIGWRMYVRFGLFWTFWTFWLWGARLG